MTVRQLAFELTQEELIAWAAFFEVKHENEEKASRSAKQAGTMRGR